MSDWTEADLRFPSLKVCREHGGLYDPVPHPGSGEQQLCHAEKPQPRWATYDFNEWVHLCEACLQDTVRSGSRFSPFFCEECRNLLTRNGPTIPRGRHSLTNIGVLPPQADVAARRVNDMFSSVEVLHRWSRARLQSLLGEGNGDPDLATVMAEARRRWDKRQAVADLVAYWRSGRKPLQPGDKRYLVDARIYGNRLRDIFGRLADGGLLDPSTAHKAVSAIDTLLKMAADVAADRSTSAAAETEDYGVGVDPT
jgi:hypothetical protein